MVLHQPTTKLWRYCWHCYHHQHLPNQWKQTNWNYPSHFHLRNLRNLWNHLRIRIRRRIWNWIQNRNRCHHHPSYHYHWCYHYLFHLRNRKHWKLIRNLERIKNRSHYHWNHWCHYYWCHWIILRIIIIWSLRIKNRSHHHWSYHLWSYHYWCYYHWSYWFRQPIQKLSLRNYWCLIRNLRQRHQLSIRCLIRTRSFQQHFLLNWWPIWNQLLFFKLPKNHRNWT
jgi:hypothetical protein